MTQRRAANKKFLSNRNLLVCGFLTDSQERKIFFNFFQNKRIYNEPKRREGKLSEI
jgi:hypothetical protein